MSPLYGCEQDLDTEPSGAQVVVHRREVRESTCSMVYWAFKSRKGAKAESNMSAQRRKGAKGFRVGE